ncbi:hypothetical protein R5R35_014085 [Gryllus longicercus]|uniref:Uncharacterized protein n=1 Tax=Gryllus longicercus TaxID=2509291 RepID=A0AAN9ZBR8_9ORTH
MSEVTDVYFDSEDEEVFDETKSVETEEEGEGRGEDPTKPRDLEGRRVINLGDPVDHQDAATKLYVDNQFSNAREFTNHTSKEHIKKLDEMRSDLHNLSANQTLYLRQWQYPGPFNADLFRISNVGNPEEDRDATPRSYVDTKVRELKKEVDKIPPIRLSKQGNVNMRKLRLVNVAPPRHKDDAVTKQYVDANMNLFTRTALTQDNNFNQQRIINVADPVDETDVVNLRTLRRFLNTN